MALPVTLLDEIKSVLEAEQTTTGLLSNVQWLDWGAALPPLASSEFPLIFISVDRSRHPIVRAAQGTEESYDEYFFISITCASYIVKGDSGEGGYKAAMREAASLFTTVKTICHSNKKWNGECYTSEFAEDEDADWGTFPLSASSTDIAYGITAVMTCRIKGQTSSSSSSSSGSSSSSSSSYSSSSSSSSSTIRIIDCDGQYYGRAATSSVHDVTTEDISVSARIKVPIGYSAIGYVASKDSTNLLYEDYGWYLGVAADGRIIARCIYGIFLGQWGLTLTGTTDIRDNLWHHISVVFDRSDANSCKILLDGVDDTDTRVGSIGVDSITNLAVFSIGCSRYPTPGSPGAWTVKNNFNGRVADVRLYYAVGAYWSDAQMAYQAANPWDYTASAGTITEYWRLDEGSGTTLNGSDGNDLTLSDASAWVEDTPP